MGSPGDSAVRSPLMDALDHLLDLFIAGGWAMWPLLALSIVSIALSIERLLFWLAVNRRARGLPRLFEYARTMPPDQLAKKLVGKSGFYAEFMRDLVALAGPRLADGPTLGAIAAERVEAERPAIERFTVTLSTIITAAPMIGILGTVSGIISSFKLLGDSGAVTDPTAVAGGVAEALLTTAFGLCVALVTLFPFVWSKGQSDRCLGRLEAMVAALAAGGERGNPPLRRGSDESPTLQTPQSGG